MQESHVLRITFGHLVAEYLRVRAEREERSMSSVVRQLVREAIEAEADRERARSGP